MANYKKLAKLSEYLTTGIRTESKDQYYFFKDETPEEIKEWFQDITSKYDDYSFVDLDEYYRVLNTLAYTVSDFGDEFTEDELYQIEWADIYNADRLDWLKENLNRAYVYDDIKDQGADGIFELIGDMQDRSRADFAQYIINNLGGLKA